MLGNKSELLRIGYYAFIFSYNNIFHVRKKPHVLQIPITGRCNSRCLTCNVWKKTKNEIYDLPAGKLREILKNSFFSEVVSVGLNGGEFTLDPSTLDVVDSILILPKLKSIFMISNGLYPKRLLEYLEVIKQKCYQHDVTVGITLSIDGIGNVQNLIRGVNLAWAKSCESLNSILKDKCKYCDVIGIGCTISKYNVAFLPQVETFFSKYEIPIEYHLAVPNKRIGTFQKFDYSVLSSEEARLLALEFFFRKMESSHESKKDKLKYYLQYKYLLNHGKGRMLTCDYLDRDITIDENLNMYLCATASDTIGDLKTQSLDEILKSNELKSVHSIVRRECNTCIHYAATPTFRGWLSYISYQLQKVYNIRLFRFLTK